MATFELTAPDGGTYHVDAPDEHAAVAALGQMLAPKAQAAPRAEAAPESRGILRTVDDTVRSVANGMTLGLADRFAAGMAAMTGVGGQPKQLSDLVTGSSDDYAGNLAREQRRTGQFETEHPIGAIGANLVGGAVVPIGAIGAAAKGASLGAKTLLGGGTGAVLGGAQGAFSSNDLTDLPQTAKKAAMGLGVGLILGGAIPAAGKVIGAGYNAAANAIRGNVEGMSRGASNHLVSALEADGPAAVQQRVAELGPDAMLADAGPAFLGKAQGASLNSDEGRSVLQTALANRNEGTNQRIMGDVNRALGPAEDPQTVTNAIKARRTEVDNRAYPAALDNAPAVKIAPIMTDLVDRISQTPAGSMEHKALTNLQAMLTKVKKEPLLDADGYQVYDKLGNDRWKNVPYSHDDAGILHKVKGELDNVIEYDAPGLGVPAGALSRQQGALKQMRGAINDALETQVPGYAAANRESAALARRGEAVNLGTQYLGNGKTTASPGRFADEFTRLEPGEQIAFAKGSRGNVDRVLGTKANDLQALRGELQGEGGWNTAKIATVHGQPAADELAASVDRNLAFRNTHNKLVENSQTAQRTAAKEAMSPQPPGQLPLVNPNMTAIGLALSGAKKGLNAAYSAVRPDPTRNYGEVARALTEQGTARDARLQSIVDALDRRRGNAAGAAGAGDLTALGAAIAGNSYARARSGPRKKQQ